ncbi:MAG: glycosyltransferase [Candidatus Levybacteria bacterium]|nr:glycosyltransferase [Candidatus Levybacteria bacterium]
MNSSRFDNNSGNSKKKRVALVYDRVNKWGGAERVLLSLHKIFPQAPLYTSAYNPKKAPWAKVFDVRTSFLQKFPFSSRHELYAPLMPLAFESFNFDKYDLVISVTSESAKGIITKPDTAHICYLLTPTRYLWSGYRDYFKNKWFRYLSYPAVSYLRFWDKIAAQRPDAYLAISNEVQSRTKKYYGRDSKVVYPPVTISHPKKIKSVSAVPYYLIVSRLVPYKKVDIVVRAFNKLGFPLKIVGTGSQESTLKKMAKDNIEFLGHLTEKELLGYYQGCKCLIFPGIEDFGLTILEANSFGKPAVAYKDGGALETVVEGKTGIFFDKLTPDSLTRAVRKFDKMSFDSKTCMKRAGEFSFINFKNNFRSEIKRVKRA